MIDIINHRYLQNQGVVFAAPCFVVTHAMTTKTKTTKTKTTV